MADEEELHEYFPNRPNRFVIYFTFSFIVSVFGIFGNVILIFSKLRRFSHLSGLEIILVNLSIALIMLSCLFLVLLTDEMFHELSDEGFCKLKWFLQSISLTSVSYSAITILIISKYFSKMDRKKATILISLIWIVSLIDAFPYFEMNAIALPLKNGKSRNVCHLDISSYEEFDAFRRHQLILYIVESVFPTSLLIIASCVSFFWKKPDASTNRIIFTYSLLITTYFTLFNLTLVINRFGRSRGFGSMNLGLRYFFRFGLNFTVLMNVLIYGYFDKFFVRETTQILSCTSVESNSNYEHQDDDEVEKD